MKMNFIKRTNIYFALALSLFAFVYYVSSADITCAKIKYAFNAKGLYDQDGGADDHQDDSTTICPPQGKACCSPAMERKLTEAIHVEMDEALKRNIAVVLSRMSTRTVKFDAFFLNLQVKAKQDFHKLFLGTYGIMYEQNSHVALKLFDDLLGYYKTGTPDLITILDGFFHRLYETMFIMLNRQFKFNEQQIECMRGMMDEVQPFGTVPRRLSAEIKRAFVASRIFVQSLAVGSNVMKTMMKVGMPSDCTQALMKMSYCPQCHGYMDLKPCNNYCLNVMKGCLAYHSELGPAWDLYVAKLMKLSVRLQNAFNIEDVVKPIHLEISHAIMNFQENSIMISKKVQEKCGRGNLMKRSVAGEIKHETYKFPGGRSDFRHSGHGPMHNTKGSASGIGLSNHISDVRKNMNILRSYWHNLPRKMCSSDNVAAKPIIEEDCWNGLDKAKYQQEIIGDGLLNQSRNPEVKINIHRQNSEVNDLIISLKLTADRLAKAHDGIYVNWTGSELSGIENLELDDLISSAELTELNEQFEGTLVEGSGSGSDKNDDDCKDDDCDDNPVSTFTITGSTTTARPTPLTTIHVMTTTEPSTTTEPRSPTTTKPAPSQVPDDCEGSGCFGGSGSGNFETDDEDLNFHLGAPKIRPSLPPKPDANTQSNTIGRVGTVTQKIPAFTPDYRGNGQQNPDLYFPTAFPDSDDPSINEIDVGSRNAGPDTVGASSTVSPTLSFVVMAAIVGAIASRL